MQGTQERPGIFSAWEEFISIAPIGIFSIGERERFRVTRVGIEGFLAAAD